MTTVLHGNPTILPTINTHPSPQDSLHAKPITFFLPSPFKLSYQRTSITNPSPLHILPSWSTSPKPQSSMKNRASTFLKEVFKAVVTVVKAKTMAVKHKTSAIKTRLMVLGLLRHKNLLLSTISHKIHALTGKEKGEEVTQGTEDYSNEIVMYNVAQSEAPTDAANTQMAEYEEEEEEDDYLTHTMFDMEDEDDGMDDGRGSVIDLVKNSREDAAADFSLEDEIDHVADVFIRRFHKQMKMQKLESFKRYQDMLERST